MFTLIIISGTGLPYYILKVYKIQVQVSNLIFHPKKDLTYVRSHKIIINVHTLRTYIHFLVKVLYRYWYVRTLYFLFLSFFLSIHKKPYQYHSVHTCLSKILIFQKLAKLCSQMMDNFVSKKRLSLPADKGKFCPQTFDMCRKIYQHTNPIVALNFFAQFVILH